MPAIALAKFTEGVGCLVTVMAWRVQRMVGGEAWLCVKVRTTYQTVRYGRQCHSCSSNPINALQFNSLLKLSQPPTSTALSPPCYQVKCAVTDDCALHLCEGLAPGAEY